MKRKTHDAIIRRGITLDDRLFEPFTLSKIERIERILKNYSRRREVSYVAVPLVQPYGGPVMRKVALPEEEVNKVHQSYEKGEIKGVCPSVGRIYNLKEEKEKIHQDQKSFNPDHYPQEFISFLEAYAKQS